MLCAAFQLVLVLCCLATTAVCDPPAKWFEMDEPEEGLVENLNATLDALSSGTTIDTLWMDTLMGAAGITFLQSAAQRGYTSLTKKLLEKGAKTDIENDWGWRALQFAAGAEVPEGSGKRGDIILQLIRAGTDINHKVGLSYRHTALDIALHYSSHDAIDALRMYQASRGEAGGPEGAPVPPFAR